MEFILPFFNAERVCLNHCFRSVSLEKYYLQILVDVQLHEKNLTTDKFLVGNLIFQEEQEYNSTTKVNLCFVH